jgi:outer membrane protein, adhesin transport system
MAHFDFGIIMMRFKKFSFGLLLTLSCLQMQKIAADTLVEVIERTLATHPEIVAGEHQQFAADEGIKQARAGYLPRVQLTAAYGREYSDNASTRLLTGSERDLELTRQELGVGVSQMLFDGFAVKSAVSHRTALRDSAAYRLRNSRENVAQATAEAYLNIFRRQTLLELAKNHLVVHQKNYRKIEELFNSGAGRKADLQHSESRLALAESLLINAEGNLTNAFIYYQQITGETAKNLMPLSADPMAALLREAIPVDIESALNRALEQHPSLLTAKAEINAAEANYTQSGAILMPQLNLELGGSKNKNLDGVEGNNDDWYAMLRLNYALYQGGADRAKRVETAQLLAAIRENLRQKEREIEQDVRLAWNNLTTTRQRFAPLETHLRATSEVVAAYQEQFKIGQRSLLDVLDSETELFRAHSSLIDLQYSEWIEIFNLLNGMGVLLSTLDIRKN